MDRDSSEVEPDEPPWLDQDEMESWLALASLFTRLPSALDAQLRRDAGISHFEYQVLAMLSAAEGHALRMSTLAELADGSLSRLSHVATRLEKRGWIARSPDPDDGRFTTATLTGEGMTKLVETAPGHVRSVRRLVLDPLAPDQVGVLGAIARRIVDAIEVHEGTSDLPLR
ncbi:MAG: MarR family winged helix-turn-helix transcriptional regulator [Microthrixaceae bacterium]